MKRDPSHEADRLIRNETDAADHLATFCTPDAEVTLHAHCSACGGRGDDGDEGNAHLRPCRACDGEGEISGRVPLRELLKALGLPVRQAI